ncbi:MAG: EamA family transporter [Christensenellales bacterium]|jgi:drug/metabolite transporter (DMT)-like permease
MKTIQPDSLKIKYILGLQGAVLIYTLSGVVAKYASAQEFLSLNFILLYGLELLILFIYAILWQQLIKRVDLSIAYANRAVALMWSMLWAWWLFGETVTLKHIIGVVIVIIGIMVVNSDGH